MNYSIYIGLRALEARGIVKDVISRCIKPFLHYPVLYNKEFGGLRWNGKFTRGRVPDSFLTTIAYVKQDREEGHFSINQIGIDSHYLPDRYWYVMVYSRKYLEEEDKKQIEEELQYILNYVQEKGFFINLNKKDNWLQNKRIKKS